MKSGNKIAIISDSSVVRDTLLSKINLVRGSDVIESYNFSNIINLVSTETPELIILHADSYSNKWQNSLSELREYETCKNVPVLLVCEKLEQEILLNAFDEKVTDFISYDSPEIEFLMRIIWCLQKNNLIKQNSQNIKLLISLDVLQKNTLFYKEQFVDKIFSTFIKEKMDNHIITTLVIVTPSAECRQKLSSALLGNVIAETIRSTDIVGIKNDNEFYILMNNSKEQNAEKLFNRIQNELLPDYSISAGIVQISSNWETCEKQAKIALQDALAQKNPPFVYYNRHFGSSLLDDNVAFDMTSHHKNFKLFKQSFLKKLNCVITPVFYQFQKMYEEKLFETKIDQTASEEQSYFTLNAMNATSSLSISYPGFSKINIKIKHQTKKIDKENVISLKLNELDTASFTKILEDFVKEYREISDN